MINLSEFILNFVINASWQIIVIAALTALCQLPLKNSPARYRHKLWVAALLLSVALPIWTVTRTATDKIPVGANDSPARASTALSMQRVAPPHNVAAGLTQSQRDLTYLLKPRPQPISTDSSWILAFAVAYALFIFLRGSVLLRAWIRTRTLIRSIHSRALSPELRAVHAESMNVLGVADALIACSPLTATPSTVGTRHSLIILPERFYTETSIDVLRSVLGHELAHIRRRDFALNVAYELLLLPIAFHPVTRFIKRQIDSSRELACDEMVTERLLKPERHARSLVEIAGSLIAPADRVLTVGIFDANILEERIMKLTQHTRRLGARAGRVLTATSLVLLAISTVAVSTFSFELRASRNTVSSHTTLNAPVDAVKSMDDARQLEPVNQPAAATAFHDASPATQSSDPQELAQAACDARMKRSLDAIPRLLSMLGDDREITPFPCSNNQRWTPALSSFKHPSPGEQAALALASMGAPAFGPLTEELNDSNPVARRNAAWAIGELTNMVPDQRADAVMPLISLLRDNDSWVRMAAARALGELRDYRAGEPLVAALLDTTEGVRLLSAWALGEMKDERAVDSLSNVLVSDARIEVRIAAAEALGEIRNPRAIVSLNQALNDAEPRVRSKARWALSEIEDSDG